MSIVILCKMVHHFVERSIFIFHDTYASPSLHWYKNIATDLEKLGYRVYIPHFPTPIGQSEESWERVLDKYRVHITEETIVIGHGVGALFALNSLPEFNEIIRAVYLIAPFEKPINHEGFDQLNKSFIDTPRDTEKIKKHARHFYAFIGSDDPYVDNELSREVISKYDAREIVVKNGGHFTSTENAPFTELYEHISKLVAKPELTPKERMQEEILRAGFKKDKSRAAGIENRTKINTYYDQIGQAVSGKEAGAVADILEEQREEKAVKEIEKTIGFKKILLVFLTITLVVAGIIGAKYFRSQINPVVIEPDFQPVQIADYTNIVALDISSFDDDKLFNEAWEKASKFERLRGTITAVVPVQAREGVMVRSRLTDLAQRLGVNLEPFFLTTQNDFMLGAYHDNGSMPFLIIKFTDIEKARNAVLSWEVTMLENLTPVLNIDNTGLYTDETSSFNEKIVNNYKVNILSVPSIAKKYSRRLRQLDIPVRSSVENTEQDEGSTDDALEKEHATFYIQEHAVEDVPGELKELLSYTFYRNEYLIITTDAKTIPAIVNKINL